MTYAFHTPDKLCFVLDLMNGGDLHYHLSQHGVFNEQEMRFYAAEVILGKKEKSQHFLSSFFLFFLYSSRRSPPLCLFIFNTIMKEIIGVVVNMGGKDYTSEGENLDSAKGGPFSLAPEISNIAPKRERECLYFIFNQV